MEAGGRESFRDIGFTNTAIEVCRWVLELCLESFRVLIKAMLSVCSCIGVLQGSKQVLFTH